jgi:hypothetical protein
VSDGETAGATGCTIEGGNNIGIDDGSLYIGVGEAGEAGENEAERCGEMGDN